MFDRVLVVSAHTVIDSQLHDTIFDLVRYSDVTHELRAYLRPCGELRQRYFPSGTAGFLS